MANRRKSGVLLHPTSLPGPGGIGTLGREAYGFIDLLHGAGQTLWQVLPLNPTAFGNSPYMCYSAFAGNPLLIDLDQLCVEGDLSAAQVSGVFPDEHVAFEQVIPHKIAALTAAADRFFTRKDTARLEEFWHFCDTTPWLDDFALFMALKSRYPSGSWRDWPIDLAAGHREVKNAAVRELGPLIGSVKYQQWQFFRQWRRLRAYASSRNVGIFGDLPIFVAYDSADVWCNRGLFLLDESGNPSVVAGVPPDYFSKTGQLWGNPLYDWHAVARDEYAWWIARVKASLEMFDLVRIDHFRGFAASWHIPFGDKTAVNGRWVKGPGDSFFTALASALGQLPLVAEDLGVITPDVEALRDRFAFPGMKILQFAFDAGPDNPYLPHNFTRNAVIYTGTHDNDTTAGWFASVPVRIRKRVLDYLGQSDGDIVWDMIRLAMASVADTVILPLQDVLGLPSSARMNVPGSPAGNWSWRCSSKHLRSKSFKRLQALTELYGRCPQ